MRKKSKYPKDILEFLPVLHFKNDIGLAYGFKLDKMS